MFKIKRNSDGKLGFLSYATKSEARAAAKAHVEIHGRVTIVNADGSAIKRAARNASMPNFEAAVRAWNFTAAGTLNAGR